MARFIFSLVAAALFGLAGVAAVTAVNASGDLGYVALWFVFGMAALSIAVGLPTGTWGKAGPV